LATELVANLFLAERKTRHADEHPQQPFTATPKKQQKQNLRRFRVSMFGGCSLAHALSYGGLRLLTFKHKNTEKTI